MPTHNLPYYYLVMSGLSLHWRPLAKVEESAGFPATAHPTRRKRLEHAVRLGHAHKRQLGQRVQYRLTELGELYLDEAFDIFGPPPRLGALFMNYTPTTPTVAHVQPAPQTDTVEAVLEGYASFKRTSEAQYAEWCQRLYRASIQYAAEGGKGSFLDYAAEKTGLSRVTVWRDVRAGTALVQGVQPAQQADLVSAATCLDHGKTPDEVNAALSGGTISTLAASVTTGTTKRQMTARNAEKFDQVRELLGNKYRVPAPRLERDEVLHDLFLYLDRDHPHLIQAFVQASTQGSE